MFLRIIFTCLLAVIAMMPAYAAEFWYGSDGPTALAVDSAKVLIKVQLGISPNGPVGAVDRLVDTLTEPYAIGGFVACSLSTGDGYAAFLDSLEGVPGIEMVEPYYLSPSGLPMLVGTDFCVAFADDVTYATIDSINAFWGVDIVHESSVQPKTLLLRNSPQSGYRVVEIANLYHDLPGVTYAHPDFSAPIAKHSYGTYDHYHPYQYHIKKVIGDFNSASVWDFAGAMDTVVIALLDDGVAAHEDLPAERLLPGYDFYYEDSDPSPGDSAAHGMGTAGIIAASHNTDPGLFKFQWTGVVSMNPAVKIIPLKIFDDWGYFSTSVEGLARAFDTACVLGADIISNSWGFVDPWIPNIPRLDSAIESATLFGRNGLGSAVVFSSGNTDTVPLCPQCLDPYPVRYPARLPYCLSVGALQLDDYRWDRSCYSEDIDINAPSSFRDSMPVWSLDQMGALGWIPTYFGYCIDNDNYNCHFGGTSAASPMVSGTISLLMSIDSTLSFDEYYDILRNSAVTNLDWGTITPPHNEYGYGRVDAFRAVLSLVRGDVNNDGIYAGSDLTYLIGYLFRGGPAPFPSPLLADVDCDGDVDVADNTFLTAWLFQGGPAPARPCFEYGD